MPEPVAPEKAVLSTIAQILVGWIRINTQRPSGCFNKLEKAAQNSSDEEGDLQVSVHGVGLQTRRRWLEAGVENRKQREEKWE